MASSRGTDSANAAAEAYRILRSTVKHAAGEMPIRSVLVVDIDRTEQSGVAQELAAAFARAEDRCVLVDTDTRHGIEGEPGFVDLVQGNREIATVAQSVDSRNLSRVGPGTHGGPDVLSEAGVPTALKSLTTSFEHVILQCASLPRNGDALALAPHVDATILVVTAGRTRRPRAIDARDALDRVGARLLGVVLMEPKRSRFW